MHAIPQYLEAYAPAIAFNVILLVICFLIARVANVKPIQALVFGFLPLLFAMALLGGSGHELLSGSSAG